MSAVVEITPPDGLARLNHGLTQYYGLSGKEASAVLVQKGGQLVFGNQNPKFGATFPGLIQLFMGQAPKEGAITAATKARGFRLGRISPEAYKRAKFWLGGFKSILAHPSESSGRISLGAVRVGTKAQRILGGRRGRGGFAAPGGLANATAENAVLFPGVRQAGDKRLGLRAVATVMEINLRESGRRYLGVSWLFKRWRRLAASDPRRDELGTWRVLENVNPRARVQLLGDVELGGDLPQGQATLRISSHVPGISAIGQSRGLFDKAIEAVARDTEAYLARKQTELLLQSLRA